MEEYEMMKSMLGVWVATLFCSVTVADDFDAVKVKLEAAMQADVRTERDVARDRNRKPIATLEFFGLRDDMRVIELMPGGGWYTKLLAPVLAEDGELYLAISAERVGDRLAGKPGFESLKVTARDASLDRPDGARFYDLTLSSLGVEDADMVFTFRNYHNFSVAGRGRMNEAVFEALKPGGIYAVVDHTRRHMESASTENGRRVDPVMAIKEIESAGFEFVDYATLHFRADDELRYEVGRRTVTGNTDRWTLKFRKPL
ncbi:MAG: methyltransferase [Gammaproteobacteria bacterium]|nr:methyltransferase [Gammaproteobacteria bacterium]